MARPTRSHYPPQPTMRDVTDKLVALDSAIDQARNIAERYQWNLGQDPNSRNPTHRTDRSSSVPGNLAGTERRCVTPLLSGDRRTQSPHQCSRRRLLTGPAPRPPQLNRNPTRRPQARTLLDRHCRHVYRDPPERGTRRRPHRYRMPRQRPMARRSPRLPPADTPRSGPLRPGPPPSPVAERPRHASDLCQRPVRSEALRPLFRNLTTTPHG